MGIDIAVVLNTEPQTNVFPVETRVTVTGENSLHEEEDFHGEFLSPGLGRVKLHLGKWIYYRGSVDVYWPFVYHK